MVLFPYAARICIFTNLHKPEKRTNKRDITTREEFNMDENRHQEHEKERTLSTRYQLMNGDLFA